MTAKAFEEWLCREMPPNTIISDPAWWATRIERQFRAALLSERPDVAWQVERMRDSVKGCPFPRVFTEMNDGADLIESLAAQVAQRDEEIAKRKREDTIRSMNCIMAQGRGGDLPCEALAEARAEIAKLKARLAVNATSADPYGY